MAKTGYVLVHWPATVLESARNDVRQALGMTLYALFVKEAGRTYEAVLLDDDDVFWPLPGTITMSKLQEYERNGLIEPNHIADGSYVVFDKRDVDEFVASDGGMRLRDKVASVGLALAIGAAAWMLYVMYEHATIKRARVAHSKRKLAEYRESRSA